MVNIIFDKWQFLEFFIFLNWQFNWKQMNSLRCEIIFFLSLYIVFWQPPYNFTRELLFSLNLRLHFFLLSILAEFINENWKFRDEFSVQWIRRQCKSGFAYGVFTVSEATAAGELAPTTLNMVYKKPKYIWNTFLDLT